MTSAAEVQVTDHQLHILRHSLGLDYNGEGRCYRNYFCTAPDGKDGRDCIALVEAGLMDDLGAQPMCRGDHYFRVTDQGLALVTARYQPAKLTRSQARYKRYLKGSGDMSFGEWLKTPYGKLA